MKERIECLVAIAEEQNGFRAGRSCIDGIFSLKSLLEKRIERGRIAHLAFVDLQKAYDTVPLCKLWPSMDKIGVSKTYIKAVQELYKGCKSMVKVGAHFSESFPVSTGLRQGCSLAPLL